MKKMILMLVAIMIAACGIKAINIEQPNAGAENNSEYKSPDSVISCLNEIIEKWGDKDKAKNTVSRNPESGAIISKVTVMPFTCKDDALFETKLKNIVAAFDSDQECAYNYGKINHDEFSRDGTNWATYTGEDDKNSEIILSGGERLTYDLLYMEVKNADDPTKRDFYAIKWRLTQEGCDGKIFLITSKRPDLIVQSEVKTVDEQVEDLICEADKKEYLLYKKTAEKYKKEIDEIMQKRKLASSGDQIKMFEELINDYKVKYRQILDQMHALILQQ